MIERQSIMSAILVLNQEVWEGRLSSQKIDDWLDGFDGATEDEKTHALYLVSRFMFIGDKEIRALLRRLYEDLYRYPIIQNIRAQLDSSPVDPRIGTAFQSTLQNTRFVGLGGASGSGAHLAYPFRQENSLGQAHIVASESILSTDSVGVDRLADSTIERYVFIDDFAGTGHQAVEESSLVTRLKSAASASVDAA